MADEQPDGRTPIGRHMIGVKFYEIVENLLVLIQFVDVNQERWRRMDEMGAGFSMAYHLNM